MKLSEAIREGAKLHPQGFGGMRRLDPDGSTIRTCALGAAMLVMGRAETLRATHFEVTPPCACHYFSSVQRGLGTVVIHLNDGHRWTREQIADWVEIQEKDRAHDRDPSEDA